MTEEFLSFTELLRFFCISKTQGFDCKIFLFICFPDTDLATDQAVFLAGGNTVINFWIVHEPADLALCGFMTDRTSGACHFSVFHDFFSYSKLSENIFIVIRIGNVNLIFFLLWILIYVQRRVIDYDHIIQFLQNFRCIVCVCQCSVKSIFLLNLLFINRMFQCASSDSVIIGDTVEFLYIIVGDRSGQHVQHSVEFHVSL